MLLSSRRLLVVGAVAGSIPFGDKPVATARASRRFCSATPAPVETASVLAGANASVVVVAAVGSTARPDTSAGARRCNRGRNPIARSQFSSGGLRRLLSGHNKHAMSTREKQKRRPHVAAPKQRGARNAACTADATSDVQDFSDGHHKQRLRRRSTQRHCDYTRADARRVGRARARSSEHSCDRHDTCIQRGL